MIKNYLTYVSESFHHPYKLGDRIVYNYNGNIYDITKGMTNILFGFEGTIVDNKSYMHFLGVEFDKNLIEILPAFKGFKIGKNSKFGHCLFVDESTIELKEKREIKRVYSDSDPYGEEDWEVNEDINESNPYEILVLKDWSYLYGKPITNEIKLELEEYEKNLKLELLHRKITFKPVFSYDDVITGVKYKKKVTTVPPALEMKIEMELYDDWQNRLRDKERIYSDKIRRIIYFIYSDDIYLLIPNSEIVIFKGKQIISENDPYGEEDWEVNE